LDNNGKPRLGFLPQVNLAEIAAVDRGGGLPPHGMIYLFGVCDKDLARL
jgi:uncharacterized protein YwqG